MKEVSVAVDGEEARISFVDHMHGEMSVMMIKKFPKNMHLSEKCVFLIHMV